MEKKEKPEHKKESEQTPDFNEVMKKFVEYKPKKKKNGKEK